MADRLRYVNQNPSFYWVDYNNQSRPTAHLFYKTRESETPGGTPCEDSEGVCGDIMLGYGRLGTTWHQGKSWQEVIDAPVDICADCISVFNQVYPNKKINLEGLESRLKSE